ncbi:MAG: YciI family protein [Rhizobacter sp.]|nr:YciI family protein [Rhizobacter sp.]
MRFMIIVKATPQSESGVMPEEPLMAAMADYHEQLVKAGVLLDATGLQPSIKGWRVHFSPTGQRRIVDGPFAETKELIAGYTLIQVRSRDEALEWSRRFPAPFLHCDCEIEVRQLFELDDFEPAASVERFRDMGTGEGAATGARA